MPSLYHRVPADMQGDILYPLNALKTIKPELYEKYLKKYESRMETLEYKINLLDCLWNDVLHLSPLHPQIIYDELKKLGANFPMNFFEIDAGILEPEKTAVYLYNYRKIGALIPQEEFVSYDPKEVGKYAYLLPETIGYFEKKAAQGEIGKAMMYHRVPHVLYKGTIDTTGLKVISIF